MEEENNISSAPESSENKNNKFPVGVLVLVFAVIALFITSYLVYFFASRQTSQEENDITPTQTEEIMDEEVLSITPNQTITPNPINTSTPKLTITLTPTLSPAPTNTPTPQPKADLYISEYSYSPAPTPVKEEEFTVRIGIYNKGNTPSGAFYWEWWPTHANYACRERIDNIVARGGRIVTCTYTYGGWSNYTVKAVADADDEVDESDETNNIRSEILVPIH